MISTLLTTLLIANAFVLIILIIILQQGNEGGLGGSFGGGNTTGFFGATGGLKLIVRTTWICGFLFFALAVSSSWLKTNQKYQLKKQLEKSLAAPTTLLPQSTEPLPSTTTTNNLQKAADPSQK
jgi:preprotein translocase subunit SecG